MRDSSAALGITCGRWGGVPAPVFGGRDLRGNNGVVRWNNGWVGGTGGSRTAPTGENVVGHGVHPPSPVFTRAGSAREQRREGWVPVPVVTGAGSRREDNEGKGNEIPGLCFAALGMTCGPGRKRDGSPHPRGQREGGRFPNRPYGLGHGVTLFSLVTENNKQGPKVPICWERA